jgi:TPP-dependent pyruvate/acetoin dehydrogenase alpha subunit
MIKEKIITKKEIEKMEKNIIEEVENALDFARKSPEPELAVFLEEVKQI